MTKNTLGPIHPNLLLSPNSFHDMAEYEYTTGISLYQKTLYHLKGKLYADKWDVLLNGKTVGELFTNALMGIVINNVRIQKVDEVILLRELSM